jgi:DNA polymerase III subunit epsilon
VRGGSVERVFDAMAVPRPRAPQAHQSSLDECGRLLSEVTFVVVDLETTGGSAADGEITEIGAVKVRGGETLGEFSTLVRPKAGIPPFISVLTGITDSMVAGAPTIGSVLPAFLEFSRGAVLVAHNAPFDLGFLRAAAERTGHPVPKWEHLDTVVLARAALTRDDAPDNRLSTLARLFGSRTEPCHRALADARATVDVLHGLFERLGNLGVTTVEDARDYSRRVSPHRRRKRHLADGLPTGPGVYIFRDARGRALYVGVSRSVRTRVRTYFTAGEQRKRMTEMVAATERVDAVGCAHELEARVRELRLIAEHAPPYNRRSRNPERMIYLTLTHEPYPRLARTRTVRPGGTYLGPFGGADAAESAATALHDALGLRQCSGRLSERRPIRACVLAELGRCGAPCDGRQSRTDYAGLVAAARLAMTDDPGSIVAAARARIDALAAGQRYEDAAVHRDRLLAFLRGAARFQTLDALRSLAELTAAAPSAEGGWEVAVIRYGRLAAALVAPPRVDPRPWVAAARATAQTVRPEVEGLPSATVAETELIGRWLAGPGVRLVHLVRAADQPDAHAHARSHAEGTALATAATAAAEGTGARVDGWSWPASGAEAALARLTARS